MKTYESILWELLPYFVWLIGKVMTAKIDLANFVEDANPQKDLQLWSSLH